MDWARILAYVTGTVDQELLGRNEYLAAENRILKAQLKGRPECSVSEAPIAPAQGPAASRPATQREFEASAFPSANHRFFVMARNAVPNCPAACRPNLASGQGTPT